MMSSNREDYASPQEWLDKVKEDDAWQSQLERLQSDDESNDDIRQQALMNFSRSFTFDYWNTYKHKIEPTVCDVWEDRELTLVKLKIHVISMLTLEWIEKHSKGKKAKGKKTDKKVVGEVDQFAQAVVDAAKTEAVITELRRLMEGKTSPRDVMLPVRAAMEVGVIRRPTWGEFNSEFKDRIKSKSSFSSYTQPENIPYQGPDFDAIKEIFRLL